MGTTPDSPQPELRASDAEREAVAKQLQTGFGEGRLTFDELQERLEQTYAARTHTDLDKLLQDLPPAPIVKPEPAPRSLSGAPGQTGMPGPFMSPRGARRAARWERRGRYVDGTLHALAVRFAILTVFFIAIWAISGRHGSFWPIWPIVLMAVILGLRFARALGR